VRFGRWWVSGICTAPIRGTFSTFAPGSPVGVDRPDFVLAPGRPFRKGLLIRLENEKSEFEKLGIGEILNPNKQKIHVFDSLVRHRADP
jgi:hypothetical protein